MIFIVFSFLQLKPLSLPFQRHDPVLYSKRIQWRSKSYDETIRSVIQLLLKLGWSIPYVGVLDGLTPNINRINKWMVEFGFRPPFCTYRLKLARTTSCGFGMNEMTPPTMQTQDSKFEPWRSEAEYATSRPMRFPQYWIFMRSGEKTFCVFKTCRKL